MRPASSAFRNPPSPVTSVGSIITTSAALRSSPTAAQINDRLPNLPLDTEDCHDMHQLASDGPETLYAQVLENAASPGERANTTLRLASQIMYLGETFNLTHLLHQTSPNRHQYAYKLHYLLPLKPKGGVASQGNDEDTAISELLRLQSVFNVPHVEICHELFRVYFKYAHPHYPILDRGDFASRYHDPSNPPSYLLLQAVLFMAAGHCPVSLLYEAGFKSRYDARLTLFKRAKALYDADYESDQVTIVQSLFLMSFWWNTLIDQKDTWYWLGNSISLAVTLGMHRSTRNSDLSLRDQRLWKKIWWSLFAEDKHAAAALGRPVHIRLRDCDVEPLNEADFEEEAMPHIHVFDTQEKVHVSYVICLSELSKILEHVIEKSFITPNQMRSTGVDTREECQAMLEEWEARLPEELQFRSNGEYLWTKILHIAHR